MSETFILEADLIREVDEIRARTAKQLADRLYWTPAQVLDSRGNVAWIEPPPDDAWPSDSEWRERLL